VAVRDPKLRTGPMAGVRSIVKPPNQMTIARQLRKRIKNKFDKEGIEIPFP
jgi:small-conductance mechanosensitive channel